MPLKYLKGKSWSQVTREERYFCSHLYHQIINNEKPFVNWFNQKLKTNFAVQNNWEIAFEACFYRDYHKQHKMKLPENLRKRTFDLCLFSDNHIIIIEAKVQQGFKGEQLNSFIKDEIRLTKLLKSYNVKISKVLLYSSEYNLKLNSFRFIDGNSNFYEITWDDLCKKYKHPVFNEANGKYKK